MGTFKLGKMTLRGLTKKPETVLYPFEQKPQPDDLKGHIEPDMSACILCGICMKRCPTGCITVDKKEGTWSINSFDCIQCRTCVRECPKDCLVMEPDYQKPSPEMAARVYHKPEPTPEELAAKEAEKQARIAAAKAAKEAKEAAASSAAAPAAATGEAEPEFVITLELQAQIDEKTAGLDADKAAKVRAGLIARAKRAAQQ